MPPSSDFPSGSSLEQLNSEEPDLDSKIVRLMITTDIPQREEGLHGSKFIECMDYSITSFQVDPRVKIAASKFAPSSGAPAQICTASEPSGVPSHSAPHPISRGFGSLIRKISMRSPPKRELAYSPSTGLVKVQPQSHSPSLGAAGNLCRKTSNKSTRHMSALIIDHGKTELWRAGTGKKTFTASCSPNSATSPLSSLSSSTSSSSTHSRVLKPHQANQDSLSEIELGRSIPQRSNSTTQNSISQSLPVRSPSKSSKNTQGQTFEVLSRSRFMKRSNSSSRHEALNGKHATPPSLSILSKSTSLRRHTENLTDRI